LGVQIGGGRLGYGRAALRHLLLEHLLLLPGGSTLNVGEHLGGGVAAVRGSLGHGLVLHRLTHRLLQPRETLGDAHRLRGRSPDDADVQRASVELDAVVRLNCLEGLVVRSERDVGGTFAAAIGAVVDAGRENTADLSEKFL